MLSHTNGFLKVANRKYPRTNPQKRRVGRPVKVGPKEVIKKVKYLLVSGITSTLISFPIYESILGSGLIGQTQIPRTNSQIITIPYIHGEKPHTPNKQVISWSQYLSTNVNHEVNPSMLT